MKKIFEKLFEKVIDKNCPRFELCNPKNCKGCILYKKEEKTNK
jgi:hypothetical protein